MDKPKCWVKNVIKNSQLKVKNVKILNYIFTFWYNVYGIPYSGVFFVKIIFFLIIKKNEKVNNCILLRK